MHRDIDRLTPQRHAQLEEINRLERAYDVMPPDVARRIRQLAAGTVDPSPSSGLPPLKSASELIAWRAHLQAVEAILNDRLPELRRRHDAARTVTTRDTLARAIEWMLSDIERARAGIAECERELAQGRDAG